MLSTRYEITGGFNRPPLETSSTMALYERAEKVARELGMPPLGHASVGGASDGNLPQLQEHRSLMALVLWEMALTPRMNG